MKYEENRLEIENKTYELKKVNQELNMLKSYTKSILMSISEGVAVIDELGNIKYLNEVVEKTWPGATNEINEYFGKMIREKRNSDIHRMIKEKKPFYDMEVILSTKKMDIQFLVSGAPIETFEDNIYKGVIIIRPIKEVHELVNRFIGAQARFNFDDIITNNEKMLSAVRIAHQAALGDGNVLIQGESGTGKEMFAQAIHNRSRRYKGPFVAVNCGAIPRDLIGSELFGYAEGAFTGAKKGGKPGKFELASGGTIFLDEIGDMPFDQQVALLRVIQEKKVTRIGGEQEIPVDVRIICATNKNLLEEMRNENFRQDLYYRLNVISIRIPPLRERREDIPLLFKYFLEEAEKKGENHLESIDPLVIEYLMEYDWHGNVRELQNVVERIIHIVNESYVSIEHLPEYILESHVKKFDEIALTINEEEEVTIKEIAKQNKKMNQEQERYEILILLKKYKGNITKIAKEMGISRSTLYRKMENNKINKYT